MGNVENVFFSTEEFNNVMESIFPKLIEMLQTHQEELFIKPLSDYLNQLLMCQRQENLEPVYCISISFLNTALMQGKPLCRIDAYGKDRMLYLSPMYTQYVDWAPFKLVWDELLDGFQKILAQRELQKYCSPLQAEQAAWYCMGPILSMVASIQKYQMGWLKASQPYQQLIKGEGFKVEFGEFWDWKVVLSREKNEVDLFNSQTKKHTYHRFQNKVFSGKKFNKFDLSGSEFENCEFRSSVFFKTDLNDCVFSNCVFQNVKVHECQMAGSCIVASTLDNVEFMDVVSAYEGLKRPKSWYRPMTMIDTSLEHVDFHSCILDGCCLERCTTTFVTVTNSSTGLSDFSMFPSQV